MYGCLSPKNKSSEIGNGLNSPDIYFSVQSFVLFSAHYVQLTITYRSQNIQISVSVFALLGLTPVFKLFINKVK